MVESIQAIRSLGYDHIHVSSYPVRDKYQNLSNYYFYRSTNIKTDPSNSPHRWLADSNVAFHIGITNHFNVSSHFALAIKIATSFGYNKFIYNEFDNILSKKDESKIEEIFSSLDDLDAFFFSTTKWDIGFFHFTTFGGKVDFFEQEVKMPATIDDWKANPYFYNDGRHESIEHGVRNLMISRYANRIKEFEIENLNDFFPNSIFDKSSAQCGVSIARNTRNPLEPYVFIDNRRELDLYINGNLTVPVSKREFRHHKLNIAETGVNVEIREGRNVVFSQTLQAGDSNEFNPNIKAIPFHNE
jgi:hypothetical protein